MERLIKKYKNRRLYDTEKSQYITIDDLKGYVVDGLAFRVEDSTTGKDITNETLLQILVEMEGGATKFLSSEILRQLIVLASHPMNQSLKAMFEQTLSFMQKQLETNPYFNEYQQATETLNKQFQDALSQWQSLFKK